jgi:hypothetical protein
VLAGGLDLPECAGQDLPRRVERRFARTQGRIDRAEAATDPRKARRRLEPAARLLAKTADGVERLGNRGKIAPDCAAALAAMLTEAERRAIELATAL